MRLARAERWNENLPEVLLWQHLRAKPGGFKFRHQFPFGPYSLDFACLSVRLGIEIDGEIHSRGDQPMRDAARDSRLQAAGFQILRVPAREVLRDLSAVVLGIVTACHERVPLHHPRLRGDGPPPRSGEE